METNLNEEEEDENDSQHRTPVRVKRSGRVSQLRMSPTRHKESNPQFMSEQTTENLEELVDEVKIVVNESEMDEVEIKEMNKMKRKYSNEIPLNTECVVPRI